MPSSDPILRPSACSSSGGGLDAAWVHVAPTFDCVCSGELDSGDLAPLDPPGELPLVFAAEILIP